MGNVSIPCMDTTQWVSFVAWHPDGQTLASASGDHSIKIWNFESGQCLKTLRGHSDLGRVCCLES